jgi:hypothetical protein
MEACSLWHLFDGVRHDVVIKLDFIQTNLMPGLKRDER